MTHMRKAMPWDGRVGNGAQVAGIEVSELTDGPGRGVRIAWVNTGTPLRFKVVIDRGLDIADAFYGQHSLAWLSACGTVAPQSDPAGGTEWLRGFGGGLVTTCGLSHVGPPEPDAGDARGVHGRASNLRGALETVRGPSLAAGDLDMTIEGVVREMRLFGPQLELRRRYGMRVGEPTIRIRDVVTNVGNTPAPHMLLYHCNFGWPLIDRGTRLLWKGGCESRGLPMDDAIFAAGGRPDICPAPDDAHRGSTEACGFIRSRAGGGGMCTAGVHNARLGLALRMDFRARQLPWITNWQHWGPGEYVTALEPGTHPPIGQQAARAAGTLILLAPGESRTYELTLTVLAAKAAIADWRRMFDE